MILTYKYRLKPNKEQEAILNQWVGITRWIWNYYLERNKDEYKETGKFIFKYEMMAGLPKLKKKYEWLKDIPSQALQGRCCDLDLAIKRVWKQGNGFPKFKSKYIDHHNTLRISQTNGHINPRKKQIKIPKIGWVNWVKHRPLQGKLKNITIKKENGFWWCCCVCDIGDVEIIQSGTRKDVVGIDLGLKDFAICSDGRTFKTPKFYRKHRIKLKRVQQNLSRKLKRSKNREKSRKLLSKLHFKIKNQRNDFTHKTSGQIANDYCFIAAENLNIKGMMKNRHLSNAIADQGWNIFINQLIYKSELKGGCAVKIDRYAPSSKTCSSCGNIQEMPLNIRIYECNCGLVMDRDLNAAYNIKEWGINEINRCGTHQIYACGDTANGERNISSSYVSMKQEKFDAIGIEAKSSLEAWQFT